jgi:hypothetical protein
MITKYINLTVFILSFSLGIFAVYVTLPDERKVIVYPSPDNIDYIQYKDKAGNCFKVKQTKTKCQDNFKIFNIPPQAP